VAVELAGCLSLWKKVKTERAPLWDNLNKQWEG
jgi:hypothetical protein